MGLQKLVTPTGELPRVARPSPECQAGNTCSRLFPSSEVGTAGMMVHIACDLSRARASCCLRGRCNRKVTSNNTPLPDERFCEPTEAGAFMS